MEFGEFGINCQPNKYASMCMFGFYGPYRSSPGFYFAIPRD